VLETPIAIPDTSDPSARSIPRPPYEVLYAGAVYWAQEDAVKRLARVCAQLDDVRLTIVGDEAQLRAAEIEADRFELPLPAGAFRERVRQADVVVLGLSFDSEYPAVIATATPARLPEYMASGTPLLVHAPAGSHVAIYARREDFAEVVDEADDSALAVGLRHVIDDPALSGMRARHARDLALERHEIARVRQRFLDALAAVRR
jgi:glycosyltransferase involved in cell wall biosynthesis